MKVFVNNFLIGSLFKIDQGIPTTEHDNTLITSLFIELLIVTKFKLKKELEVRYGQTIITPSVTETSVNVVIEGAVVIDDRVYVRGEVFILQPNSKDIVLTRGPTCVGTFFKE